MDTKKSNGAIIILGAVLCNFLFGTAVPMIKLGYGFFGITDNMFEKILFAGTRFFISGILVFIIAAIRRKGFPSVPKEKTPLILLHGFIYTFLQYAAMYVGLSLTSGTKTSVIGATNVFMLIIASHFIYKNDKITSRKAMGSVLGFCGVIIALAGSGSYGEFSFIGDSLIFLTAAFFVAGSIIGKKITQTVDSFTMTAYNLLFGGFLLIVVALFGGASFDTVNIKGILSLAYLIMVSSVAFTLWAILLSKAKAGNISVFSFVNTVTGTVLSALIEGENILTLRWLTALTLLCCGIIIVNLRNSKTKNI